MTAVSTKDLPIDIGDGLRNFEAKLSAVACHRRFAMVSDIAPGGFSAGFHDATMLACGRRAHLW